MHVARKIWEHFSQSLTKDITPAQLPPEKRETPVGFSLTLGDVADELVSQGYKPHTDPVDKKFLVKLELQEGDKYPKYPLCTTKACNHWQECGQHNSAGEIRENDGQTPLLYTRYGEVFCDRTISDYALGGLELRKDGVFQSWNKLGE